jgi:hypothetical protein
MKDNEKSEQSGQSEQLEQSGQSEQFQNRRSTYNINSSNTGLRYRSLSWLDTTSFISQRLPHRICV